MQKYVTGKGCLMSFTLGFIFLDSQIKHLSVSLRLLKIYVADLYTLNCVIEKKGIMTNTNTDFVNVESFWI